MTVSSKPTENAPGRKQTFAQKAKPVVTHYLFLTTIFAAVVVLCIYFLNSKAALLSGAAMVSILLPAFQTAFDSGWNKRFKDLPKGKRCNLACTLIGMLVTAAAFLASVSDLFGC